MRETFRTVDRALLAAVVALVVVGAGMVYSASFVVAHNEFGNDSYFLVRQLGWIALGTVAMLVGARLDYHHWRRTSLLLLLVCVAGLVLVLTPSLGVQAYGAQRWLRLGSTALLQPSEFAKLAIVIYLADWAARRGKQITALGYGSIPFVVILGLVAGLVLLQPDLGTAFIIALSGLSIFFVAGANLWHFTLGLAAGGVALYEAVMRVGYRQDRLAAFLDPWRDPQSVGWHTIQTLIALGSGGVLGVGLGVSRQKTGYVPNPHTDAIFAILGEELGLVGTMLVLFLFTVLAWRGLRAAFCAPDAFGRLLATGITAMLTWQAAVNVAVVTNTVPYTGVTLPFISYGGSSLIVSLAGVGILLSVSRHAQTQPTSWRDVLLPGGGDEPAPVRRAERRRSRRRRPESPEPWQREDAPVASERRPRRPSRGV